MTPVRVTAVIKPDRSHVYNAQTVTGTLVSIDASAGGCLVDVAMVRDPAGVFTMALGSEEPWALKLADLVSLVDEDGKNLLNPAAVSPPSRT